MFSLKWHVVKLRCPVLIKGLLILDLKYQPEGVISKEDLDDGG